MTAATAEHAKPLRTDPTLPDGVDFAWRMRHLAVCVLLAGFAFNSDPGRIGADTKLDLAVNPAGFLARALHLWNPQGAGGQVQNQAYGYLFPIGPFYAVGKLVGLPAWVTQRLWWSLLLCVAFLGVVTLTRQLTIGTPFSRLLAGLAFALSPHLLSVLGPISAEALPMCLAPWVLVPLVKGARDGPVVQAAMRSGVAVLCMGGANATLNVAALVPTVAWFLTRRPGPRLRRLAGAWIGAVALASLWWVVPLVLLGRYSPPFLDFIETASITTSTTSLVEALRGTGDWVAYLQSSGWQAGWEVLTRPGIIVNSVVVVGLGLAGLALRQLPHRLWLVTTLLMGTVMLTLGHLGSVHGLFAGSLQGMLDGALSPLRNVHKFDVAIRLPLVIGLAHLVGGLRWGASSVERRLSQLLVIFIASVAVVGTSAPLIAMRLAPSGTFTEVPSYWRQTAEWLGAHGGKSRALVVPGSNFGTYYWGRTLDEPLQALAKSPWEIRDAVPLVPPDHIRMLDAVERQLASGRPSPGLARYLEDGGIGYIVVRNDLDYGSAPATRPIMVHQVLQNSPGFALQASFGGLVGSDGLPGLVLDQHLQVPYPAVEIFAVQGAPADNRVDITPMSNLVTVSGGPESLLNLADDSLLGGRPAVLATDLPHGLQTRESILTDGFRRREVSFGSGNANRSPVLTATEPFRFTRPLHDYLSRSDVGHLTVARYLGANSVSASSSASTVDSFGATVAASQPYSAIDADPLTAWASAQGTTAIGQWLQIDLDTPQVLTAASITMPAGSLVTQVRVSTAAGSRLTQLTGPGPQALTVLPGPSRWLRVTVNQLVSGAPAATQVGIADLSIPGVQVSKTLVVPDDLAPGAPASMVSFEASADARNGCQFVGSRPLCAAGLAQQDEEDSGLDRTFTVQKTNSYDLTAWATPRAGPALDALINLAAKSAVTATASSQAVADPLAGPEAVVDGDPGTGWVATATDPAPSVTLSWHGKRTLSSMQLVVDRLLAATRPTDIEVTSPDGARQAKLGDDGRITFAPLTTNRITLRLLTSAGLSGSFDPMTRRLTQLGLGVSEVIIPGLDSTPRGVSDSEPLVLACGTAPAITIDSGVYRTQASTTVGKVRRLEPVELTPCSTERVVLEAGTHRLTAASVAAWRVSSANLRDRAVATTREPAIGASVRQWGATSRVVSVEARPMPSLLIVHENANAGWTATMGDQRLQAITIDGWQQGYLVPAGSAGAIQLSYEPDRIYRWGLACGLIAVLALLGAATRRPRRKVAATAPVQEWTGAVALPVAAGVGLALTGGFYGLATWVLITVLLGFANAGRVTRFLAPISYLGAGLLLSLHPWASEKYLANDFWLQLLCLVALASVAAPLALRQGARPSTEHPLPRAGEASSPDLRSTGS